VSWRFNDPERLSCHCEERSDEAISIHSAWEIASGKRPRTVTRLYASLRAAGCSMQPPVNIPVEILSIAERRLWPFCPPPGQNGQGQNGQSDASDQLPERAAERWPKWPRNVLRSKRNGTSSTERPPDLLITRLLRLLGPARTGLARALLGSVDEKLLEVGVSMCEMKALQGCLRNPGGYLCRVVGYESKGGRTDGEKKGR
jgi:hypothetical protein